jgi:hypothetical protein
VEELSDALLQGLTHKLDIKLERLVRVEHSSIIFFFIHFQCCGSKKARVLDPGNPFQPAFMFAS